MGGKTEWYPDARGFNVKNAKIVHHGNPQGTKENVTYYARANDFTFDTLDITHYANGGTPPPPPPNRPAHDGPPSSPHGGRSRPAFHSPPSVSSDSRSTVHKWLAGYQPREAPETQYRRPGPGPLQHLSTSQGLSSAPVVNLSAPSNPNAPQNPNYGSYGPDATFPSDPLNFGARMSPRDALTNRAPQDGESDEEGDETDNEIWQMSDDEDAEPVGQNVTDAAENVLLPRLLEFMAEQPPSYTPSDVEILEMWQQLVGVFTPASRAQIITAAHSKIDAWRTGFIERAVRYLDERISPKLSQDIPDREARQRWALSMKPSGKKKPPYPFYFKDPVAKQGSFMSDFIAFTLSHHLKAVVVSVPPQAEKSGGFPLGALALTLIACERAIDIWANETQSPRSYGFRGARRCPDVWQLVTTQLDGRGPRQKKILEAATRQLQQASGPSTTLGSPGHRSNRT